MKLLLLVLAAIFLAANAACADPVVTPKTITPVWFPHGISGACAGDGAAGAPAGAVAAHPSILSGYAHPPTCLYANFNFGIGSTGLGTPIQTTADTLSSSSTLTFAGGVPGYVVAGLTAVDQAYGQYNAIPSTITVSSTDATHVFMSGNVAAKVNSGDTIAFYTPINSYTPPACASKNTSSHILFVETGNNCTIGDGVDFRGATGGVSDGGWKIYIANVSGITVNNAYVQTQANAYDGLDCAGGNVGTLLVENSTFNGGGVVNSDGGGELSFFCPGTINVNYVLDENAWIDGIDAGGPSGTVQTLNINYIAIEDIGWGTGTGVHPDIVQEFGLGTFGATFTNPVFYQPNSAHQPRGVNFGDYTYSVPVNDIKLINPLFVVPCSACVQQYFALSSVAEANTGTTVGVTGGWVDPAGIGVYGFFDLNGQDKSLGAGNCSFSGTTMTCSSGTFAVGNYIVGVGLPHGTNISSGSGPYTLNSNVGTIGAEPVGIYSASVPPQTITASASDTALTCSARCGNIFSGTKGTRLFGPSLPAGLYVSAGSCGGCAAPPYTFTLSASVGAVGSETMETWFGPYADSPTAYTNTNNTNMNTGATCGWASC